MTDLTPTFFCKQDCKPFSTVKFSFKVGKPLAAYRFSTLLSGLQLDTSPYMMEVDTPSTDYLYVVTLTTMDSLFAANLTTDLGKGKVVLHDGANAIAAVSEASAGVNPSGQGASDSGAAFASWKIGTIASRFVVVFAAGVKRWSPSLVFDTIADCYLRYSSIFTRHDEMDTFSYNRIN
jgi:hypothetical protein